MCLASSCPAISNMLHGRSGRFTKDAQTMVVIEPFFSSFFILCVAIVCPCARRRWRVILHGLISNLYFAVCAHTQFPTDNKSGRMRGRLEPHRYVIPDERIIRGFRLFGGRIPVEQAFHSLRRRIFLEPLAPLYGFKRRKQIRKVSDWMLAGIRFRNRPDRPG